MIIFIAGQKEDAAAIVGKVLENAVHIMPERAVVRINATRLISEEQIKSLGLPFRVRDSWCMVRYPL